MKPYMLMLGLGTLFAFASPAAADMCCYVIPVEVQLTNLQTVNGFLKLYGDEIHGKTKDGRTHVVSFGMNEPSTPTKLWESAPYDFEKITLIKGRASISFGKRRRSFKVSIVDYFFSGNGLVVHKDKVGGPVLKTIPMNEVRSIRRTGPVKSIASGSD
jgi:hypothetical protein